MNKHLRRLWRQVQLDENMAPILPLDWNVRRCCMTRKLPLPRRTRLWPDEAEA